MSNKKETVPAPPLNTGESTFAETQSVVLFGKDEEMLPEELEQLGLGGKVIARELPGVAPTWKPLKPGDMVLGRCVDYRSDVGVNKSSLIVMDTAIPGGFRTVWLSADLKVKFASSSPIGRVFSIAFQGTQELQKGRNPIKLYRVVEVIPKQLT